MLKWLCNTCIHPCSEWLFECRTGQRLTPETQLSVQHPSWTHTFSPEWLTGTVRDPSTSFSYRCKGTFHPKLQNHSTACFLLQELFVIPSWTIKVNHNISWVISHVLNSFSSLQTDSMVRFLSTVGSFLSFPSTCCCCWSCYNNTTSFRRLTFVKLWSCLAPHVSLCVSAAVGSTGCFIHRYGVAVGATGNKWKSKFKKW